MYCSCKKALRNAMQKESVIVVLLVAFFPFSINLFPQSLWVDRNPYTRSASIKAGGILKLKVDEPVLIEYEYQNSGDREVVVNMTPDRELESFLPSFESERSINDSANKTIRSRGRIKFNMAVTITEIDENGVVSFQGAKRLVQEREDSRIDVQVTGRVQTNDVSSNREVLSDQVADLNLSIAGIPLQSTENISMKTEENEDGELEPSAELSDQEKQEMLLEYINRVLGEAGDL